MFTLIKAFFRMFTGIFKSKAQRLQENRHVMGATYDKAISNSEERFQTVRDAVAELVNIEQTRIQEVKALGEKIDRITKIRDGAKQAMQTRINALRKDGKTKEEIQQDAEFIKHKGAFDTKEAELKAVKTQFDDKEADLKDRQRQIANYKVELQGMQTVAARLREEKQEALADVAVANQSEAINAALAGIRTDSADEDLAAARAARNRAKSRSAVTAELVGNDARVADAEYLQYAQEKSSTDELDRLLDWGDEPEEKTEELSPAKLPDA